MVHELFFRRFTPYFANESYFCGNEGLLLPLVDEEHWSVPLRAALYLTGMAYCFLGISMLSDVFMSSIEMITSMKIHVKVAQAKLSSVEKKNIGADTDVLGAENAPLTIDLATTDDKQPEALTREVLIWNSTVANLTLMALGTSAPEILLSVIEVCGNGFESGDLGPGTIIGSAAFNLLGITAVCMLCLPRGQTRRIDQIYVFICTACFSIFAYLWMFAVLVLITPNVVELWEAFLTFSMFIIMVVVAWMIDAGILGRCGLTKKQSVVTQEVSAVKKVSVANNNLTRDDIEGEMVVIERQQKTQLYYQLPPLSKLCNQSMEKKLFMPAKEYRIYAPVDKKLEAARLTDADCSAVADLSGADEKSADDDRNPVLTIITTETIEVLQVRQRIRLLPKIIKGFEPDSEHSWKQSLLAAASVNGGKARSDATLANLIGHTLKFPWKLVCALLPPPTYWGGYPSFLLSLGTIGLITAIVGDLANTFGCLTGLKDSITAITLVAAGTSVPDLFASKIAATTDSNADNAIGNITGSNSVNVFLGLGLPWFLASIYHHIHGSTFVVEAGDLGFGVAVFTVAALLCLALLTLRRKLRFFGKAELGGPFAPRILSGTILLGLYVAYILISTLGAYGYIATF